MADEEEVWRPLGVDSDDEIARYDALHESVPQWMETGYWAWVQTVIMTRVEGAYGPVEVANAALLETMGQVIKHPVPNLRVKNPDYTGAHNQIRRAMDALHRYPDPIRIADYLLAFSDRPDLTPELQRLLDNSKSAWTIGERSGRQGLVRRLPEGVQVAADSVMAKANMAGRRLTEAWETLYGLNPKPSVAYGLAIKAVEDAAVPVVSPTNTRATLGTVIGQMEAQKNWTLPMEREHAAAPTKDVVVTMLRMLWWGQHDRHGGQPSAPGNVSPEEANVAVLLAVTLVGWFDAGMVARR